MNGINSTLLIMELKSIDLKDDLLSSDSEIIGRYYICDENPAEKEVTESITDVKDAKVVARYRFSENRVLWTELNLANWESVEIIGLTSRPLVINEDAARTYGAGHHNFSEYFLYEPILDRAIEPDLKEELRHQNIRAIFVEGGRSLRVIGFDKTVRNIGNGVPSLELSSR